jgi:hypothetical protein
MTDTTSALIPPSSVICVHLCPSVAHSFFRVISFASLASFVAQPPFIFSAFNFPASILSFRFVQIRAGSCGFVRIRGIRGSEVA